MKKKSRVRKAENAEGWDGQFVLLYCYINQEKTSLRRWFTKESSKAVR